MRPMTPFAKGLGLLFGLPVVLTVIFVTYFNVTGESRMRHVCGEVKAGMNKVALAKFIDDYSLNGNPVDSGAVVLSSAKSYGRHTCKVDMEAGVVKAANYRFAD